MTTFLIAGSEPRALKAMGTGSNAPENFGVDIMWSEPAMGGLVGIQRKEIEDLIASVQDGRLAKEVHQMANLKMAVLVVEGRPHWTPDGWLVTKYTRWSRAQHRGILRSLMHEYGVIVEATDDVYDTISFVREVEQWAAKGAHLSLARRPKPAPTEWGAVTDKGWASHLLQSVPGIGAKQAELIWDHFGGVLPIGLTCDKAELTKIKGLGPKRVEALMKAFSGTNQVPVDARKAVG